MQVQTIHINFAGGIVSPGYLKEVLQVAADANVAQVRFGLRQQLIIDVPFAQFTRFENDCAQKNILFYKKKTALPNIISSFTTAGVFNTNTWLREGVYKDVFDLLHYTPALKINICDSTQSFAPLFTGHINWVSSTAAHFWHLYIRFPKTQVQYHLPQLIYTNDMGTVSKEAEKILLEDPENCDGNKLYRQLQTAIKFVAKPVEQEAALPKFSLPYYEGFNKYDDHYWLGIYRRNEAFPVSFLLEVCTLCTETKIGQLHTTPWKSIIIKGIDAAHRQLWDYVLGKYRINVRHAANELAWQVEDNNEEGLQLKRQIIRYFDKEDVRTYGLCFAVQTYPHSGMFGSIVIKKQEVKNPEKLKTLDRYEILYSNGFNPNSFETVSYRAGVEKEYLGPYLVSLCKYFYEEQNNAATSVIHKHEAAKEAKVVAPTLIHQCKHCFSVYDETFGDEEANIAAGTAFNELPSSYHCPLCDSDLEDFVAVEENSFQLKSK